MSKHILPTLLAGAAAGFAAAAGAAIYRQRAVDRIPSPEGIEDPAVAKGFAWVTETPQMRLLRRFVMARGLRLRAEGRAADLGCGAGQLAIVLAQAAPGLHVTGVDLSTLLLEEASGKAAAAGLSGRVDFRSGDAAATPFEDGSLDLVVSTLSLHHWSDPAAVLREVARILRPGGAFMIFDLRRDMVPPAYVLIWLATHYIVPRALRWVREPLGSRNAAYTPEEVAALAQASPLTGWRVAGGPFWLSIEGKTTV